MKRQQTSWGGRVTIARRTASGIVMSGGRGTAPAAVTVAGAVRGRSTFLVVGLQGGQCDGEDDVFDQGAAREVVDRLGQALQHRPYAQAVGVALDGLRGGVAGMQIGEDELRGLACDQAVRLLLQATA